MACTVATTNPASHISMSFSAICYKYNLNRFDNAFNVNSMKQSYRTNVNDENVRIAAFIRDVISFNDDNDDNLNDILNYLCVN